MATTRLITAAGLLLLCLGGASAQEKKEPKAPDKYKGAVPPAWAMLNLSDAQKEELLKQYLEYKARFDKLEDEIKRLKAEQVKKRMAVLTDEQRKKLREQAGEPEPPAPDKKPKEKGKDGR
jgi:flagellar basal body-associated protein FliL